MSRPGNPSSITRRRFLRLAAGVTGGVPLAATLASLQGCGGDGPTADFLGLPQSGAGFGPLREVPDDTTGLPLLKLPEGFRYQSFGWTGDEMSDGTPTPGLHDGMAVVAAADRNGRREWVLIRNHERALAGTDDPVPVVGKGQAPIYDDFDFSGQIGGLGGGTTALSFAAGRFREDRATLGGTMVNCAGGPTPWGSWLSCEELMLRGGQIGARDHGYVFEVPAPRSGAASAVPIKDMGFMPHEAVAVDPATGYVYLTEDNGPRSGLYRFRPDRTPSGAGNLEQGGRLEMLAVRDTANADLRDVAQGREFPVQWVPVENPDADPEDFESPLGNLPDIQGTGRSGPFLQGEALGGATFRRLEGCWYQQGVVFFVDTTGGPIGEGTVWALDLRGQGGTDRLTAVMVATSEEAANNPDNITVSPRGGILVCEDSGGTLTRLLGVTPAGRSFPFAENNAVIEETIDGKPAIEPDDYRSQEFAGATFAAGAGPDGSDVLFVNIQTPGITFAIRGPFEEGGL